MERLMSFLIQISVLVYLMEHQHPVTDLLLLPVPTLTATATEHLFQPERYRTIPLQTGVQVLLHVMYVMVPLLQMVQGCRTILITIQSRTATQGIQDIRATNAIILQQIMEQPFQARQHMSTRHI